MRIEQEIFDFYEKLTFKKAIKNQQYTLSYNFQVISILLFYLLFIVFDICLLLGIFFPSLKNYYTTFLIGLIISPIMAYIITRKTKDFNIRILKSDGKKVDINDIKEERIFDYLINKKYIIENKDNSLFYSDILQAMQFHSTYLYNRSISIQSIPMICLLVSILSIFLDKLNNKYLTILVISIFILVSLIFIVSDLQYKFRTNNRQYKYNALYLILLDLKIRDSFHNKHTINTKNEHFKFILY